MKSHLIRESLTEQFNKKFNKIIDGFTIFKFIDVSDFDAANLSGIRTVSPPEQKSRLIIPVIKIKGEAIPVPIVFRPQNYANFIDYLNSIVIYSEYNKSIVDIVNSVEIKLLEMPKDLASLPVLQQMKIL